MPAQKAGLSRFLSNPRIFPGMPMRAGWPKTSSANLTSPLSREEPPAITKELYATYSQILGAKEDAVAPLAEKFFDTGSEQLWYIGTVGQLPHVGIVKNNFRNVPEVAVSDILQYSPGNTACEQYFWKQG